MTTPSARDRFAAYRRSIPAPPRLVHTQLPVGANPHEICRRPTGGGVVDHREDWTYALVIPRGFALEELRAAESYRRVHACLAAALRAQGVAAVVKTSCEPPAEGEPACGPAGVCFQRAELYDVVNETTGEKIAGAAQKRNKPGLLFQGSLWRPAAGPVDWDAFREAFITALAAELGAEADATAWPEFRSIDAGEVAAAMKTACVLDPARFLAGSLGSDPRIRYITVGQGSPRSVT